MPLLASFLRKNHRDLKLATLLCLNQLLSCYSKCCIHFVYIKYPTISYNSLNLINTDSFVYKWLSTGSLLEMCFYKWHHMFNNLYAISFYIAVSEDLIRRVIDELPVLINDGDLYVSQQVFSLLCTIISVSPLVIASVSHYCIIITLHMIVG